MADSIALLAGHLPTLAFICLLIGAVMVAGEVISSGELMDSRTALLLGPLGMIDADHLVPSCCCLGAAMLFFRRQSPKKKGQSENSTKGLKFPEPTKEEPTVGSVRETEQRIELATQIRQKMSRSCFMCGFVEDWLMPAEEETAKAVDAIPSHRIDDSKESQAFLELRNRLSDLLGPPGTKSSPSKEAGITIERFGGDRCCLYRFLKAKSWNVELAEKKLRKTIEWRTQVGANNIQQDQHAEKIFSFMKPHWPEKIIGTSLQGNPISYFDLAQAIQTCQMDLWIEENVQSFYVTWMENSLQLQRDGRQRHGPLGAGNNMPSCIVVYNLKDLKLSHVMKCVSGLKSFVKILGIIEEHYPENLHKAVIVNVPCVFYRCVWPLVQQGLDKNTLNNIHLTEGEGRSLLTEVLGINGAEVDKLLEGVLPDGV